MPHRLSYLINNTFTIKLYLHNPISYHLQIKANAHNKLQFEEPVQHAKWNGIDFFKHTNKLLMLRLAQSYHCIQPRTPNKLGFIYLGIYMQTSLLLYLLNHMK